MVGKTPHEAPTGSPWNRHIFGEYGYPKFAPFIAPFTTGWHHYVLPWSEPIMPSSPCQTATFVSAQGAWKWKWDSGTWVLWPCHRKPGKTRSDGYGIPKVGENSETSLTERYFKYRWSKRTRPANIFVCCLVLCFRPLFWLTGSVVDKSWHDGSFNCSCASVLMPTCRQRINQKSKWFVQHVLSNLLTKQMHDRPLRTQCLVEIVTFAYWLVSDSTSNSVHGRWSETSQFSSLSGSCLWYWVNPNESRTIPWQADMWFQGLHLRWKKFESHNRKSFGWCESIRIVPSA